MRARKSAERTSSEAAQADPIANLLIVLEQDYAALLVQLSTKLGSPEKAHDALHNIYLKLRSRPQICELRHPSAYLVRMAMNLALNAMRNDGRTISVAPFELESVPDGMPGPERSALARTETGYMFAALHALPPKRREIFLARWRDDLTNDQIAAKLGLHKRSRDCGLRGPACPSP